jgi:hypothetical protein
MNFFTKNLFSSSALRKVAVATLCLALFSSMIIFIAVGCKKEKPAEKLQYVKTELGGCNLKSEQFNEVPETEADTVIVTVSDNSVHIFVGINYICKELVFETRYEIIDDVIVMYIVDTGGEYYRCTCYYTFDFIFSYGNEGNQEYKIVLIDREENQTVISQGTINY